MCLWKLSELFYQRMSNIDFCFVFASKDGTLVLSTLSMFLVSEMNECFRKLLITSDDISSCSLGRDND